MYLSSIPKLSQNSGDLLKCGRFWIAVSALSVLREQNWLCLSPVWQVTVFKKGFFWKNHKFHKTVFLTGQKTNECHEPIVIFANFPQELMDTNKSETEKRGYNSCQQFMRQPRRRQDSGSVVLRSVRTESVQRVLHCAPFEQAKSKSQMPDIGRKWGCWKGFSATS